MKRPVYHEICIDILSAHLQIRHIRYKSFSEFYMAWPTIVTQQQLLKHTKISFQLFNTSNKLIFDVFV
jgi:hypothetical protein